MPCIYCSSPEEASVSHIIPESLGGSLTLKPGVCKRCNNEVNREIEQFAQTKFRVLCCLLGLPGKHTAVPPPLDTEVTLGNLTGNIRLYRPSDIDAARLVLREGRGARGRANRIVFIASTAEELEAHTARFRQKHPHAVPEEIDLAHLGKSLEYRVVFDAGYLADQRCLRLAAKIALEWRAHRRGLEAVIGPDYAEIKSYILDGLVSARPPVSIVTDPAILGLISAPFGFHSILVASDPRSHDLVIYVGLFSLVHYKVILSERFRALAKMEEMHALNPQTGHLYAPCIRRPLRGVYALAVPHPSDLVGPSTALRSIEDSLLDKFNSAFGRGGGTPPPIGSTPP
ncbi:MAG: HNH endonuclease [Anaerolineae bacterium]